MLCSDACYVSLFNGQMISIDAKKLLNPIPVSCDKFFSYVYKFFKSSRQYHSWHCLASCGFHPTPLIVSMINQHLFMQGMQDIWLLGVNFLLFV